MVTLKELIGKKFGKKKEPEQKVNSFYDLDAENDNEEGISTETLYGKAEEEQSSATFYGMGEQDEKKEEPEHTSIFHFKWWEYTIFGIEIMLITYTLLVLIGIASI